MKPSILSVILPTCLLLSCTTASKREQERISREQKSKAESEKRLADHKRQMQAITDQYTPKDPTAEDLALTKARSRIYYSGLIKSIKALDDGISPADSIAKAAISENITELKSWKRAQMAHLARPSTWTAQRVDQAINSLPSDGLIDEATSLVLRMRKGTL